MIYTLTITAVSGAYLEEECVRVLEIDERATLEDLHLAIQKAVSFDNDHQYDFYAGRHCRNRQIRYSDDEDWEARESDFTKLQLSDVYPLNGGEFDRIAAIGPMMFRLSLRKKLIYTFLGGSLLTVLLFSVVLKGIMNDYFQRLAEVR